MSGIVINIAALQFSLEYHALEVYVAGCKEPHCPGCHNSALWDFANGSPASEWEPKLRSFAANYGGDIPLIRNVWVLGGEPLDQDLDALQELLSLLIGIFPSAKLWLWTRYELQYVPDRIRRLCSYIKTGPYVADRQSENVTIDGYNVTLASGNQSIHTVRN